MQSECPVKELGLLKLIFLVFVTLGKRLLALNIHTFVGADSRRLPFVGVE